MSTYWGYHCKTCPQDDIPSEEHRSLGAYSETWMNHGEGTLRNLVPLTPHFVAIRDGDTTGYVEMALLAHGSSPIYWLMAHNGHDIELHNEYGDVAPVIIAKEG